MGTRDESRRFAGAPARRSDPAEGAIAINYSGGDQTLTRQSRGLYISGGSGSLKVDMADGTTVTFAGLVTGSIYAFAVTKIYQTGSDATGVILL